MRGTETQAGKIMELFQQVERTGKYLRLNWTQQLIIQVKIGNENGNHR